MTAARTTARPVDRTYLAKARQFLAARRAAAVAETEAKNLRPGLVDDIDSHGETDPATGHITLAFGEEIYGAIALRNERRRGKVDPTAAERILAEHKLGPSCSTTAITFAKPAAVLAFLRRTREGARLLEGSGSLVVTYDPAAIEAAGRAGQLSADEVEACVPVQWALVALKAPAS